MIFFDCEVFTNYFLVVFKNFESGKTLAFESKGQDSRLALSDRKKIYKILTQLKTCGFNSLNYDIPILTAVIKNFSCEELYNLSQYIIGNNVRYWQLKEYFDIDHNVIANHVDIEQPTPGVRISLKLYGARIHFRTLQDLPVEHSKILTEDEMALIKKYCINDVDLTHALYLQIEDRIKLREDLSAKYGKNLLSKSDAQVAETIILSELQKSSNKKYIAPIPLNDEVIKFERPEFIRFDTPELIELLDKLEIEEFKLNANGHVSAPKWLNSEIKVNGTPYRVGIGGLHSCEKKQVVKPEKKQLLIDSDVTSYYPAILTNLGIYPEGLGAQFLRVYKDIMERRIIAKNTGDKVTSDSLKIALNGTFGKLASKYSKLYSPAAMLKVTLTGQLSLLMLIEQLEAKGITVVSANTDGIVTLMQKSQFDTFDSVSLDWELETGFNLERTPYSALYSRDVNNYIAVTTGNKVKTKGVYTESGLMKNPRAEIVNDAIIAFLSERISIESSIRNYKDVRKFIVVRNVTGGAKWKGVHLGRVARWIYTVDGEKIQYVKNDNKVAESDGAMPVMVLEELPKNIDYDKYIADAYKELEDLGVVI